MFCEVQQQYQQKKYKIMSTLILHKQYCIITLIWTTMQRRMYSPKQKSTHCSRIPVNSLLVRRRSRPRIPRNYLSILRAYCSLELYPTAQCLLIKKWQSREWKQFAPAVGSKWRLHWRPISTSLNFSPNNPSRLIKFCN